MMSFAGNGLMQLGYDEPESCEGVAKDSGRQIPITTKLAVTGVLHGNLLTCIKFY